MLSLRNREWPPVDMRFEKFLTLTFPTTKDRDNTYTLLRETCAKKQLIERYFERVDRLVFIDSVGGAGTGRGSSEACSALARPSL